MSAVALSLIQHWLTTTFSDFSNPWTDLIYFFEEIWDVVVFFLEDHCFYSPVFWLLFDIFIIRSAIKTALYLRRDYLNFLSLGRGGRPSTVPGWLQNKLYQSLLADIIGVDVMWTPFIHPLFEPQNGVLHRFAIPERLGPRPEIIGMDPLRQSADGRTLAMQHIRDRFVIVGLSDPEVFRYQTSYLTGLPALTRNLPDAAPNGTPNAVTEWGGEIAHVRPDGSTTICLHPADVDKVTELGWGQRHPLAVMYEVWLWRFFHHHILRTRTPLPHTMVIVYAPRSEEESVVFDHILTSALWWVYSQHLHWH